MNIQGYQKMTLLDFPGKVACTVFTGGCNLRCPFCHNASLVNTPREGENREKEVLSYLEKRRGILEGVCVTGGEPLLQPDLEEFLQKIADLGFAVKLDTNGSDPDKLSRILQGGAVSYVAMDIKSGPSGYGLAIGCEKPFSVFRESMDVIRSSGVEYEFRTTVVKGIHTDDSARELAELLAGEPRYFLQGFVDSGNLLGQGVGAFSHEEMLRFLSIIQTKIPEARLRGQEE